MNALADSLVCAGCGAELPADAPFPFRCPEAGSDAGDHVLVRRLAPGSARFPAEGDDNPFVRFRELLHSYRLARRQGMSDSDFVGMVRELSRAVAEIDGREFAFTPWSRSAELSAALGLRDPGGAWVKDETGNVAGSHKARHLFGIALQMEVAERTGLAPRQGAGPRLAIASCGNAAAAASVVARAAGRPLRVFVPPHADAAFLEKLEQNGAEVITCPRRGSDPPGDPCLHRFREAVAAGDLPFTVQGPENGLNLEGGETLAWEIVAQHAAAGGPPLDRLAVQVGGGALAAACALGLEEAQAMGALAKLPRLHAVQTTGAHPLERAWRKAAHGIIKRMEKAGEMVLGPEAADAENALLLHMHRDSGWVREELERAARKRAKYMWAWEEEPRSVAGGILDDETYDWLEVLRAMVATGGWPVVVDEATLQRAAELGRETTGIAVGPTGAAGLAGCLKLQAEGELDPDENLAVLFTGSY